MNEWIGLILSLPTHSASLRQRVWRQLKSAGAAALRDGVYLLPATQSQIDLFERVSREIHSAGATAHVMAVTPLGQNNFASLFDRADAYQEIQKSINLCVNQIQTKKTTKRVDLVIQQARKLRQDFDLIAAIDFFPGEARQQVERDLAYLDELIIRFQYPDEPRGRLGRVEKVEITAFQRRLWATRSRPWIDRLACAWLIRRFIDKKAKFQWFKRPKDMSADAIGFDFDGAQFTHTNGLNTFEVMLLCFDIKDAALDRLAKLVHFIDLGGISVPEASGIETILAGLRQSISDDTQLQLASAPIFDALYLQFSTSPSTL
jgi:hypothetical protein